MNSKLVPLRWVFACVVVGVFATPSPARASDFEIESLPDSVSQSTQLLNNKFSVAGVELNHDSAKTSEKKYPLVIFLHGAGGRGEDIQRVHRIARGALMGMETHAGEPAIFVAPQALQGTKETPASWLPSDLDRFLDHVVQTFPIDTNRVYLTGNSMGGYGTWCWAAHSPERFAAIAPVVGGLGKGGPKDITPELEHWAEQLSGIHVWAFHGKNDRVVPADRSERMVELIRANATVPPSRDAKLTIYPDEGHGASRKVYSSAQTFRWLFSKSKTLTDGRTED